MKIYKVITLLLTYPEQDWLQSIGELRAMVAAETGRGRHAGRRLDLLLLYLERGRLIDLQEAYVETFDRNPAHSLLIFEHTMGESRERGAAMARLVEEYRQAGLEVTSNELPDFLPVFLEFLSLISPEEAQERLVGIEDVVETLHSRLADVYSPYAESLRRPDGADSRLRVVRSLVPDSQHEAISSAEADPGSEWECWER